MDQSRSDVLPAGVLTVSVATRDRSLADAKTAGAVRQQIVAPFARALTLLGAFTSDDRWLGNGILAARTGLPTSTVNRLAHTLVSLGYLHYSSRDRQYRLAATVLALGQPGFGEARVRRVARAGMRAFADRQKVPVYLGFRRGLSLEILERCRPRGRHLDFDLPVGARVDIAASMLGWALMAGLPERERAYLADNAQRSSTATTRTVQGSEAAIEQVRTRGYCMSLDGALEIAVVATPIIIAGEAPLVLACVDERVRMSRARVDKDVGPGLLAVAGVIRDAGDRR